MFDAVLVFVMWVFFVGLLAAAAFSLMGPRR
jgi:hypothetical protein